MSRLKTIHSFWPAGDGSTLSLDFTTGVLDPLLTFTRSTSGTYIGADGLVKTMAAAPTNDPTKARFDYDPSTLAPKGLLIEGSASNIVFRSQQLNTSPWLNAGTMTVSETGSGSPANDATSNVVTWTNGTAAGNAWLRQSVPVSGGSLVVGSPYTWSVWLKARGNQRVSLWAILQGASGNREIRVDFSVSPPTVTSVTATGWTAVQAPSIQAFPNGWYRVTTGGTIPASTTGVFFGFSNSDAVPASGTNGFEAWGYQLELGGASSYIPTGASTGSRGQDLVAITSTNFSSWWTSNNPASFLVDISSTNRPLANHIFRIADSSGSAYGYQSYFNSTTMPMQVRAAMSSTASSDVAIGSNLAANTRTKIGFTVETASLKRFRDGSLANTLATPTLPPNTLTQMYIGGTSSFGNSSADFHIKQFKYWPVTLSDAAMQGFTT